jgi:predicted component of type VI protein secretion system
MIQIIVSRDGEVLARGVFHGDAVTIGRSPDNAIHIDDATFSRHHARVEPQGTGWTIRDLGSTNGVTRGGKRVAEWAINDGDELSIGDYRLTFTLDSNDDDDDDGKFELPAALARQADRGFDATFLAASTPGADQGQRERSSNLRGFVVPEAEQGACWLVERDAFLIGRARECDLRVGGLFAPAIGAVLVRGYCGFTVVNMSGRDGWLRVNGAKVPRLAHLAGSSRLEVGRQALQFLVGSPPDCVERIAQQSAAARRP